MRRVVPSPGPGLAYGALPRLAAYGRHRSVSATILALVALTFSADIVGSLIPRSLR